MLEFTSFIYTSNIWPHYMGRVIPALDAYLRGYTRLLPAPGNEVPMKSNRVIT